MQFVVNNSDLMDGLRIVTRALSVRPAKQILEGVLLEAAENSITLTCSDGTMTIENTITAAVSENGSVVLPGRLFTELCAKLPAGEVTVSVNENNTASIRSGKFRSNMSGMSAVEYPEMAEIGTGYTVQIPQNRLRDMIGHVVFAIATDESRQILTGCLLEVDAAEIRLVALDGFRLALQRLRQPYEMPEGREMYRSVIPGRVMNELSHILPDDETPCSVTITKTHMRAEFGNSRMSSVMLAGEYIDYRRILPGTFRTTAVIDRSAVQESIDRASLMAREGKNNLIRMSFHEDMLAITSTAETGDAREELSTQLTGDPIEIAFNAKYITDIIRNSPDDQLEMCFNSSVSPCIIRPVGKDDYLYLLLPVRVFQ